jgi:hypothetical protein
MKTIIKSLAITVGFALALFGGIAIAQTDDNPDTDLLARLQPLLVQVQQSVPISVTLAVPTSPTNTITVTVPALVDVDISVRLTSEMTPEVIAAAPRPALVTVSELVATGQPLLDNNGIPYELEGAEGVEVIQWISEESSVGIKLVGEIRNIDERRTLNTTQFVITFYDENSVILGVENAYTSLNSIPPNGTSPFSTISFIPYDQVGRYLIQVQARFGQ